MCKSPLHGPRNYVDRTWEQSANYSARTFSCFHAKPKISQQYGRKFENDLQTVLKETLALFRVDELKAEQRLIVEEIATGRDVFADRLRQNFNFSTVAWGIKLLESLRL